MFLVKFPGLFAILIIIALPYTFTQEDIDDDDSSENDDIEVPPTVIIIDQFQKNWEILEFQNDEINLVARDNDNLSLDLFCSAPLPIVWIHNAGREFSIHSNELRQCEHLPKKENGTWTYSKTLSIRLSTNMTSSLTRISCEYEANSVNTNVNVFIPGKIALFNSGKSFSYENDDGWIPCITSNPKMPVSLFSEDVKTGVKEKIINASYDPTRGFPLTKNMTGIYICSAGKNDTVRFVPQNTNPSSSSSIRITIVDYAYNKPWQDEWETLVIENEEMNLIAKYENETMLNLLCTAEEDIVWLNNIKLDSTQNHFSECDNFPELINGTLFYSRSLSVRFQTGMKQLAKIRCEHKKDTFSSKINVFIPDKGKQPFVHSGETKQYSEKDEYIECPTTDPRIPVYLLSENSENGTIADVTDAIYNPAVGFKLKEKHGTYICSSKNNDTVRFVNDKKEDESLKDVKFVFKLRDIFLHCGETEFNTVLILQGDVGNKKHNRSTIMKKEGIQWWIHRNKTTAVDFKVNTTQHNHPIVDMFCIQDDVNSDDGIKRGKVLSKWSTGPIWGNKSGVEIDPSKESYFYASTDKGILYGRLAWEHFRVDETIFMVSDGGNTMHVNDTSSFICKTSSKDANLTFWMELLDGTRVALLNDTDSVKLEVDERDFLQFKTWKLTLRLPLQAAAILCQIPYSAHPTLYLGAERYFRTAYLSPPKILNNEADESTLKFTVGQIHQKLICKCSGEPQPKYTWVKDNEKLTEMLNLRSTMDHNGNGLLEFPSIIKNHEGTYICYALNRIGSDSFTFIVSVGDNPTQTQAQRTKVITASSVIAALLFAVAICGFGIYRYYSAKTLLRGLTDEEIQEFFVGRPELAKTIDNQPFVGDFDALPYNKAFEIDFGDTTLDYQSILGTGEFAIVIKGSIKSKDALVAVKVAKTTADVTLFKSLLSEVKILSYIGTHANVTGLVGVTTSDIQNRNLYIYMDLCELGSLEKYLRANKNQYLNLINENQKINRKTIHFQIESSNGTFSTLDLVRWSCEVAKGMEYLSHKSIIHADLAARNVLLTRDKSARVSDFGMSKKLYECSLYVKKTKCPLPWRWMALESLKTLTFSVESDVWSYGVTLWEIFTLGDIPFPNETWNANFVDMLTCGIRMGKPKYSTSEIYSKTVECWDEHPSKRPQFSTLRNYFSKLYDSLVSSGVYDNLTEDVFQNVQ